MSAPEKHINEIDPDDEADAIIKLNSAPRSDEATDTITIDGVEYEVEDDGEPSVIATGELYDGPPITYQLED